MLAAVEIDDTLDYLTGSWELERTVVDHLARQRAEVRGRAVVTPGPPGAAATYTEAGELRLGDYRGPAGRSLQLHAAPGRPGAVELRFTDGRHFVDLDLRTGRFEAVHPCGEDTYRISTAVVGPGEYEERWVVSGPAKRYEATTRYRRSC